MNIKKHSNIVILHHSPISVVITRCKIRRIAMAQGNDRADSLAREGTKFIPTRAIVSLSKPPTAEIKNKLRFYLKMVHQKLWIIIIICKQTKSMLPKSEKKGTNILLKIKREDLRIVVNIIAGHCGFNHHLHFLQDCLQIRWCKWC